jgi:hypothetical protein
VAWPLAARAQQSGKPPTIGFMGSTTPQVAAQWVASFVQRLRELGWLEGRNVAIEYRWAEGRSERYAEIAAEFIRRRPTRGTVNGLLDDVRIYNRALSATEVKQLYNGGR